MLFCKGYRPEARGYVIYSPPALPIIENSKWFGKIFTGTTCSLTRISVKYALKVSCFIVVLPNGDYLLKNFPRIELLVWNAVVVRKKIGNFIDVSDHG